MKTVELYARVRHAVQIEGRFIRRLLAFNQWLIFHELCGHHLYSANDEDGHLALNQQRAPVVLRRRGATVRIGSIHY